MKRAMALMEESSDDDKDDGDEAKEDDTGHTAHKFSEC